VGKPSGKEGRPRDWAAKFIASFQKKEDDGTVTEGTLWTASCGPDPRSKHRGRWARGNNPPWETRTR